MAEKHSIRLPKDVIGDYSAGRSDREKITAYDRLTAWLAHFEYLTGNEQPRPSVQMEEFRIEIARQIRAVLEGRA